MRNLLKVIEFFRYIPRTRTGVNLDIISIVEECIYVMLVMSYQIRAIITQVNLVHEV